MSNNIINLSGCIAFAGSRHGSLVPVAPVVNAVLASGGSIRVGCARGVDHAVRTLAPNAHVTHAASHHPYALAARTVAVVSGASALVVFPPASGVLGPGSTLAIKTAVAAFMPVWVGGSVCPGVSGWVRSSLAGVPGWYFAPPQFLFLPSDMLFVP
jgi:hypothetical protein